jgi:cytochrome oxidase Cu insertion factor (SCO1/SenC/PrrC family)
MKWFPWLAAALAIATLPAAASAQRPAAKNRAAKAREAAFLQESPKAGEALPDVTVYDVEGREVKTSSLRGHYTVLTFGCLT